MECLKLAYYEKNLFTLRPLRKIEESEKTCVSLLYFGARYYNSDISVWLSVDPMAPKYPSMSPYVYCGGNPVNCIDHWGDTIYIVSATGKYKYIPGEISFDEGFTSMVLSNFNVLYNCSIGREMIDYINSSPHDIIIQVSEIDIDDDGSLDTYNQGTIIGIVDDNMCGVDVNGDVYSQLFVG